MKIYNIQNYCIQPKFLGNNNKKSSATANEYKYGTQSDVAIMTDKLITSKGFTSKKKDDFEIKNIHPREYMDMKNEILIRCTDYPPFEVINETKLNKWNVQLFKYMLRHPEEFKEKDYLVETLAGDFSHPPQTQTEAELILHGLKNKWLMNNYTFEPELVLIAQSTKNSDAGAKIKMKLFDRLEQNNPQLSEYQSINLSFILEAINSEHGFRVAEQFIKNPRLLPSSGFYLNNNALTNYNQKNNADTLLDIIKKIKSKPELFDKKYFEEAFSVIVNKPDINADEKGHIIKFLDNANLFDNREFVTELCGRIINSNPKPLFNLSSLSWRVDQGWYTEEES